MTTTPARTIRLQHVGRVPAVEAQELTVGDTLIWNQGEKTKVEVIVDASPKFLRLTERNTRTGEETERRIMKTRLVARVDRPQPAPTAEPTECGVCGDTGCTDPTALASAYCAMCGYDHASHRFRECETFAATVKAFEERHVAKTDAAPVPQTLAERFPVASAAVYVPEEGKAHRDIVVVNSVPDKDGTVEVLSMKQGGKALRVPLAALEELPELPPAPEGEITDWWTITDAQGTELTRVEAEDDPGARKAAMRHAAVVTAVRRDKGFAVRRLRTSELSVPVGELRAVPRFSPAPAVKEPARTVPAAAPARHAITVTSEYVGRSIPTRLRAAGAPGEMKYSNAAGALRWVLPDGTELTPGEAAKRFLGA